MKKNIFLFLAGLLCLSVGLASTQELRSGEAAIYLRNGERVIDKILDISSTRLILQLESGQEIPLSQIWMINLVNSQWNFPQERDQIEGGDQYVFLKDGGIQSGKIIDFSSDSRMFEFDTGEKMAIGRMRRIYFSKLVPNKLMNEVQVEQTGSTFLSLGPIGEKEIICEKGWHELEIDPNSPLKKWRWTSREARCIVDNPHRDTTLFIKGGTNRDIRLNQRVTIKINDLTLDAFILSESVFEKSYNIMKNMLGDRDQFYLTLEVSPIFIPARVFPQSKDERELGVQVSYVYFR